MSVHDARVHVKTEKALYFVSDAICQSYSTEPILFHREKDSVVNNIVLHGPFPELTFFFLLLFKQHMRVACHFIKKKRKIYSNCKWGGQKKDKESPSQIQNTPSRQTDQTGQSKGQHHHNQPTLDHQVNPTTLNKKMQE